MINRGFRYKLMPTAEQESLFCQFAGVCRLIYNLAIEQRRDWYREFEANTGKKLTYVAGAGTDRAALRIRLDCRCQSDLPAAGLARSRQGLPEFLFRARILSNAAPEGVE
jgi:hypothetical protein